MIVSTTYKQENLVGKLNLDRPYALIKRWRSIRSPHPSPPQFTGLPSLRTRNPCPAKKGQNKLARTILAITTRRPAAYSPPEIDALKRDPWPTVAFADPPVDAAPSTQKSTRPRRPPRLRGPDRPRLLHPDPDPSAEGCAVRLCTVRAPVLGWSTRCDAPARPRWPAVVPSASRATTFVQLA